MPLADSPSIARDHVSMGIKRNEPTSTDVSGSTDFGTGKLVRRTAGRFSTAGVLNTGCCVDGVVTDGGAPPRLTDTSLNRRTIRSGWSYSDVLGNRGERAARSPTITAWRETSSPEDRQLSESHLPRATQRA